MLTSRRLQILCLNALKHTNPLKIWTRGMVKGRKGLLLGAWEECDGEKFKLTAVANAFNDEQAGKLLEGLQGAKMKRRTFQLIHDLGGYYTVAVCSIGPEGRGYNDQELLHECREDVRWTIALGIQALQAQEVSSVCVDPMTSADAAAEGAKLAVWSYQELKDPSTRLATPEVNLYSQLEEDKENWGRGSILADGQNTARTLAELPANIKTPKRFAEEAIRILCPCGVNVNVRNLRWIEDQKMFAFLNIAKGSCEPPYFLEINYCGGQEADRPVVLIGKGVTFDSGGISLKTCRPHGAIPDEDMGDKRGSVTGAAAVIGTIKALARLGIPINVIGLIPLFENMPGGTSLKPGDVVLSVGGKTIVVFDTDNEGRLALADTLCYSDHFKPCLDVTVGDMTSGAKKALGSGATPAFSSSQVVWEELKKAGSVTGDRVWRFPLWENYKRRVKMCDHVDMCNVGKGGPTSEPCLGAAFLSEFVPGCDFLHLDSTGTGLVSTGVYASYLRAGFMTGRPTRTLVQFLANMACPLDPSASCSGV